MLGLQPKLDDDGLMRSDGRLKHAEFLAYDVGYPIILPRRNWVTKLVVKEYHERGNHATGTNQTLAALSTGYCLLAGCEEIQEWEKECAVCRRRKSKSCSQIMAPLPTTRLKPSLRAFARSAVDFAGPSSADLEGGQGVRTPPGKSQVIWVSIGNKQLDPPLPPG